MHGVPQAFSSRQDQTSYFCPSNACQQPYSGTPVLTEAHHTNVRLNPRSHYKSNGRFKSDICMVCCRLSARVRIKHQTFALITHASNLIQERLFRPRHTIQMSDLIHAAASNEMGSLSQTFSRCATGFSFEAGFTVQFELSIRFEYFFQERLF